MSESTMPVKPVSNKNFRPYLSAFLMATKVNNRLIVPMITWNSKALPLAIPADSKILGP